MNRPIILEIQDESSNLISQIQAMLLMAHGESGESFRTMSDKMQDAYIFAVCDKVNALEVLLGKLDSVGVTV